jgi:exopolysaccharide biosynthesis polyprenyl glycosylphosphotransferase
MPFFLAVDGAYRLRRGGSWFQDLYRIINAATTVGVILIAATFISLPLVYSRGMLIETTALTILLLGLYRLVQRQVQAMLRRRGVGVERVLVVGAGELGRAVMRNVVARPELGYHVVGFVDDDQTKGDIGRFKALGDLDNVEAALKAERVESVIITLPWVYQRKIAALVRACENRGVRAKVVPDLFHISLNQLDVDDIGGIPLIGTKRITLPRAGRLVKRAIDIFMALAGLALGSPLLLLIAILIRLESPGPILFTQVRVGQGGNKLFRMYKFRTMRVGAEEEQAQLTALNEASGPLFKIKGDPRRTRVGSLLRRISLDELPQLLNVLRGEMSVVGPRPGLPQEAAQYQPWHRQRLEAPPGITGLWQVSGRSNLLFDEMCLLDIYYIENWSLALDLIIMLRTIPRALLGDGAY